MNILIMFFVLITILMFIFSGRKKYSKFREEEAERYFNGSIITTDSVNFTYGLAMVIDPKTKKASFKKQSKISELYTLQ